MVMVFYFINYSHGKRYDLPVNFFLSKDIQLNIVHLDWILLLPVPNLPLKTKMSAKEKKRYYDTAASNQITGDPNAFVSFAPY